MKPSIAFAPAKTILLGEHAVVYPTNSAILTTLGLHCQTKCVTKKDKRNIISFRTNTEPKLEETFEIKELLNFLNKSRIAYREFQNHADITKLRSALEDEIGLLKIVLAIALESINSKLKEYPSFDIELNSEIPISAGFGSSAALSASIISSMHESCEINLTQNRLFKLCFEVEQFQHGNPSGGDPAIIINGGLLRYIKDITGKKKLTKIKIINPILKEFLRNCVIIHTGKANQSTGEMVSHARDKFNNEILKKIEENINNFLSIAKSKKKILFDEVINIINTNDKLLRQIGVVSKVGERIIDEIQKHGGAAKISGGGGLGEGPCGAILAYHEDQSFLDEIVKKYNCKIYRAEFGIEGLRVEKK